MAPQFIKDISVLHVIIISFMLFHSPILFASEKILQSGSVNSKIVKNFSYRLEMAPERENLFQEKFKLKDGKYMSKELMIMIKLERLILFDLNRDGLKDAVAILVGNYGGSGSFYELTVLLGGNPIRQTNSIVLGDRVVVRGIRVKRVKVTQGAEPTSEICIKMLTHKPTDPMCCPTVREERCFRFEEGEIRELEE